MQGHVEGLGSSLYGLGIYIFGVWGAGVWGLVGGLGPTVQDLRLRLRVADVGFRAQDQVFKVYSPPSVDRIWLWVYYNKTPIYPIFYLLKGAL